MIDLAKLREIEVCDDHPRPLGDYALNYPGCNPCLRLIVQAVLEQAAKTVETLHAQSSFRCSCEYVMAEKIRALGEGDAQ